MDPLTIIRNADAARDEMEWRKLEQERTALWGQTVYNGTRWKGVPCGAKYSDKPHPDSYHPDLPLRSTKAGLLRTTKAERAGYAVRPLELFPCNEDTAPQWARMRDAHSIEKARARFAELSIIPTSRS